MHVFSIVLRAWDGSRDALGDAWGFNVGQLGHLRSILDKSRDRVITCDVIWLRHFDNDDFALVLYMCWRVFESRIWSCGRLGFLNMSILYFI